MSKKKPHKPTKKARKDEGSQRDFFPAPAPPPDASYAFTWPGECQPGQPYQDHLGRRWFLCAPMSVHNWEVHLPRDPAGETIFAGQTFAPLPISHVGWRCAWITTAPPAQRPVQKLARPQKWTP